MTPQWRRVSVIYRKELLEILRDRRTLLAMVAVPVLMYPILLIGMAHGVRSQSAQLRNERYSIGVEDARGLEVLKAAIDRDTANLDEEPSDGKDDPSGVEAIKRRVTKPDKLDVQVVTADFAEAVIEQKVHAIVRFGEDEQFTATKPSQVTIIYDKAEIRSNTAVGILRGMFRREAKRLLELHLLQAEGGSEAMVEPISVVTESVAPPEKVGGSFLGTILPLVLVMMTLSGAIYPAIDLTAGERERGTLETLLAAPTGPGYVVAGKFLTVCTVSLLTAVLNLASLGLTLEATGLTGMMAGGAETNIPLRVFPLIMAAMIPFSILFSAVMVAVSCFARTFKEAQNYMAPVMIASIVPAAVGSLPALQLSNGLAIVPVLNVVLMIREVFLGHFEWFKIGLVFLSLTIYAAAAVAVAAKLFATEAAMLADARHFSALWRRRYFERSDYPGLAMALGLAAIAFAAIFHGQNAITQTESIESDILRWGLLSGILATSLLFVPMAACAYAKIRLATSFLLKRPSLMAMLGAGLIGMGSWALAIEITPSQSLDEDLQEAMEKMEEQFLNLPWAVRLIFIALTPAVCEELFFRGLLMGALRRISTPFKAILISALFFAVFHLILERILITLLLGLVLGWICWRTGSVFPGMAMHFVHNATLAMLMDERVSSWLEFSLETDSEHLPTPVLIFAGAAAAVGLLLICVSAPIARQESES